MPDLKERNRKILEAIAHETQRAVGSEQLARTALIQEGIYTKKGQLRAEFGGGKKKTAAA